MNVRISSDNNLAKQQQDSNDMKKRASEAIMEIDMAAMLG